MAEDNTDSTSPAESKPAKSAPSSRSRSKGTTKPKSTAKPPPAGGAKKSTRKPANRKPPAVEQAKDVSKELGDKVGETISTVREGAEGIGERARDLSKDLGDKVGETFSTVRDTAEKGLHVSQETLGKAASTAARETRRAASLLGVKTKKITRRRKIESLFHDLGETYYLLHTAGNISAVTHESVSKIVARVDKLYGEIQELEERERKIRTPSG